MYMPYKLGDKMNNDGRVYIDIQNKRNSDVRLYMYIEKYVRLCCQVMVANVLQIY